MSTQLFVGGLAALWAILALQITIGLRRMSEKQDHYWERTFEHFDGLREYLYEIDPQFDEERELLDGLHSERSETLLDGKLLVDLENEKKSGGRRTLRSAFADGGFRSPRQKDFEG